MIYCTVKGYLYRSLRSAISYPYNEGRKISDKEAEFSPSKEVHQLETECSSIGAEWCRKGRSALGAK